MSPSSASTSAASIRRSTFRPERAAFNLENDATVATSEDFDPPQHSRASSSRHSVASTVPSLSIVVSSTTWKRVAADYDSVANSFSSTKKVVADADHETVESVEESVSRRRDIDFFNVMQSLNDRQYLHNFLEQKAELAVWEKKQLRKDFPKLTQIWKAEIGNREHKMLLFTRLIKNSNLNDYNYNKRINWLIRVKERDLKFVCRLGNEKKTHPRKSRRRLPINWRIAKNLMQRNR